MNNNILKLGVLFWIGFCWLSCAKDSNNTIAGSDSQGGSLARFAIVDNQLYTVSLNSLMRFDISEAKNPVKMYELPVGRDFETIFPLGTELFIGTREGMRIYDVSNPDLLKFISNYQHVRSCDPVVANDSIAFVTLNTDAVVCSRGLNQLEVIDIKDRKTPKNLFTYPMIKPKGMALGYKELFVCDDVVRRFAINDNKSLTSKEFINKKANDAILKGNILMLIGENGLTQYDVSNNTSRLLSEIPVKK